MMKRIFAVGLGLLTAVFCASEMKATKRMANVLTKRQQVLATISCLEAKGEIKNLEKVINEGLDNGVSVNEIKEALSQLYAYTGFPRSLNALGTLQKVVARRKAEGKSCVEGKDADKYPESYDALKEGTRTQTELTGKRFDYDFCPATDFYLKAHLFGDIFIRNNLVRKGRELVTVSALSGLEGVEQQLFAHVNDARKFGVSDAELQALPDLLEQEVGALEGWRARKAVSSLLGLSFSEGKPVDFSIWPKGKPNTAYAEYFVGNSWLAAVNKEVGLFNVTFEPSCRNNWHIHHGSVQVLICVSGRGWYQEWGKPVQKMLPGTVIAVPSEVKHWHGAAKDSWFQHLTYTTNVQKGASNEWLELVENADYNGLE